MDVSEQDKVGVLTEAMDQLYKEAVFWRDRSWTVTAWLIGVQLTITAASIFVQGTHLVAVLPILALTGVATYYLHGNYSSYKTALQVLSDVNEALGFFEKGKYLPDSALYPETWRKPKVRYTKGTGFFIVAAWIVAVSCIVAIGMKKETPQVNPADCVQPTASRPAAAPKR